MQVMVEPVSREVDVETLKEALEGAFRVAFNLRVPVTMAPCGSLPRYELKTKRIVDQRPKEFRRTLDR